MASWDDCDAVERHPEKVSGAWVFKGTRVPITALFEAVLDHEVLAASATGPSHERVSI